MVCEEAFTVYCEVLFRKLPGGRTYSDKNMLPGTTTGICTWNLPNTERYPLDSDVQQHDITIVLETGRLELRA